VTLSRRSPASATRQKHLATDEHGNQTGSRLDPTGSFLVVRDRDLVVRSTPADAEDTHRYADGVQVNNNNAICAMTKEAQWSLERSVIF
jgi:hypothetical protein